MTSSKLDHLRSFVRRAADVAAATANAPSPIKRAKKLVSDLIHKRIEISSAQLTSALAQFPDVDSASVSARDGGLRCDVTFTTGEHLQAVYIPERVSFAPRGAKELTFRIEPASQARSHRAIDVASVLGGVVARSLWPVRTDTRNVGGGIVDRHGEATLTVDLRTTPTAQALLRQGQAGALIEVLQLGDVYVTDGALVLVFKLPTLEP
jgi:hypothetical protein